MPEPFAPPPDNDSPNIPTRARRLMNAARAEQNARHDAAAETLYATTRSATAQNATAQNATAQNATAQNATATPVEPKSAPEKNAASPSARPGARARDLNRRIRDALREQTSAVYASPGDMTNAVYASTDDMTNAASDSTSIASVASASVASSSVASTSIVSLAACESRAPRFADSEHSQADRSRMSTHAAHDSDENGAAKTAAAGSWEDIADEVAPNGISARHGLATGAMRGASRRDPNGREANATRTDARHLPVPLAPRVIHAPLFPEGAHFDDVAGGSEQSHDAHGTHYLVSRAADAYDVVFNTLGARLEELLRREVFPALSGARVEDLLFVDIETTGLSSSSPLFLVGALHLQSAPETPHLDLFLARDYPEEASLLAAFHELASGKSLVTFNGKSFDWPYIEGRSRAHRLRFEAPPRHLDLLHHARRTWKHKLPNCKLQTLELHLCSRTRLDDVPGSQIPRVYHEFARRYARGEGGAHLMAPVLHHNALDILTMAELLCLAGEEL